METINIHGAPNILPASFSGWEIDNTRTRRVHAVVYLKDKGKKGRTKSPRRVEEGVCVCVFTRARTHAHVPCTMEQRVAGLMGDGGQGRLHGEGDGAKWAEQVSREGAFRPEPAQRRQGHTWCWLKVEGVRLGVTEAVGGRVTGDEGRPRAISGVFVRTLPFLRVERGPVRNPGEALSTGPGAGSAH